MITEKLEQKLESYKKGLMFFAGIALTLLAFAGTTGPQQLSQFWIWYLFWAITQVAVAWLLLLSFLIKSNRDGSGAYSGAGTLVLYALVASAAITLAFSYWRLRITSAHSPEEMFP